MLSHEENTLLTQTNAGTPMGEYFRRYWLPAMLAAELPAPDSPPVRVRLFGENLIAFRDTNGRAGLVDEFCPHRGASLFLGRNEACGLRCIYHGWKFDVNGRCVDMPNERAGRARLQGQGARPRLPLPRRERRDLDLHGPASGGAAVPRVRDQHAAARARLPAAGHAGG